MSHSIAMKLFSLSSIALAATLAGCGGGSDNTSSNTPTTTVSGVAMAGPISGQVCAYPIGSNGAVGASSLACVNTDPTSGAYSMTIADYIGNIMLAVTGTYIDEATGQTITLTTQNPLRSITGWQSAGGTWNAAITPLTEAAMRAALASGNVSESAFQAAVLNLANAMGLAPADFQEAFDDLFETLPALTGSNLGARTHASLLDLLSTAQSQYCAGDSNCTLFDYLNSVAAFLGSSAGSSQLGQSMQAAYSQWQAAHANDPYVCSLGASGFVCTPNSGNGGNAGGGNGGNAGGGNGGSSGNYNLNLIVNALGTTTPITITSVPKPDTQDEFCTSALQLAQNQANVPGATWTMDSCSFDGNHGVITATVSITSPVSMSIPYSVDYTYTAI